jgi:exopolysaccharide biosynthesis polyprenyl glycosylphosphotransferase
MPREAGTSKSTRPIPVPVDGHADMRTRPLITLPASHEKRRKQARRTHLLMVGARVAVDGALLVFSFLVAYWMRYNLELGRDVLAPESLLPVSAFVPYIGAYAVITLLAFQMRGLYALPRGATWFDHLRIITGAALIGVAALTLGALLLNPVLPSRLIFVFLWLATIGTFAVERFAYRQIRMWLWRRGINTRKALVVGAGVAGQRIMKDILERRELGYELSGYVCDDDDPAEKDWQVPVRSMLGQRNGNGNGPLRLGSVKDVRRIISRQNLHEVIVALPANRHSQILGIIDGCRESGVDFKLVPDLFEMRFNEVRIDALNGVPLIGVKDVALQGFNLVLKRALDILLALGGLLVASPILLVSALLVKATSPGPVIFKQRRVGRGGREFTCYKFRTMHRDAEHRLEELLHLNEMGGNVTFKMKDDPRQTSVGRVLRRTSIDELPQMLNILKGEMSWVGPRPPTPAEVARYSEWHRKRLDVTPGLTGLWQVSGRSELSFDEMVKLDIYYAENWSLAMDTMIILRTIPAVLKREGAY